MVNLGREADKEIQAFLAYASDTQEELPLLRRRASALCTLSRSNPSELFQAERLKSLARALRWSSHGARALSRNLIHSSAAIGGNDWLARLLSFGALLGKPIILSGDSKRASDALDALKFALRVNPTKKPAVGSALLHASALKMHVVIDPESPEELHAGEFQVVAIASGEPFARIDPSHFGFGLTVDPASGQEPEIDRFRFEPAEANVDGNSAYARQFATLPRGKDGSNIPLHLPFNTMDASWLCHEATKSVVVTREASETISATVNACNWRADADADCKRCAVGLQVAAYLSGRVEVLMEDCILIKVLLPGISADAERLLLRYCIGERFDSWREECREIEKGGEDMQEKARAVLNVMRQCTGGFEGNFLEGAKHALLRQMLWPLEATCLELFSRTPEKGSS